MFFPVVSKQRNWMQDETHAVATVLVSFMQFKASIAALSASDCRFSILSNQAESSTQNKKMGWTSPDNAADKLDSSSHKIFVRLTTLI